MAGSEGTAFENPAYESDDWDDNDDDDDGENAEETNPFIPDSASSPVPSGEDIPMKTRLHEKGGLPSYAETSFTGAQSLSEQAWFAAKKIFPDISSSELEVSYSSKGKLQVKMFGAGKKTYSLFTKDKSTGIDQINPSLSKEIKTALGDSKYEQVQKTIYEKGQELKEKQYEERQKNKKEMDEIREAIKKKQSQIDYLENEEGSQEEIDKLKSELRSLETEHQKKASEKIFQSLAEQMVEIDFQAIEDSEAAAFEKEEEEDAGEALKAIRRRKEALEWRIRLERNKLSDTDAPPERKEAAKNKLAELQKSFAKITEEEKVFQTKLSEKSAAFEKEIKKLQIDREEMEKANKKDAEIFNDENASPEEKEAARDRIETRDEEIRAITTRLEELNGEKPLLERVKDAFKKYGLTLTAIILAAGTTVGAIIGVLTRSLKATGKAVGNGLKELGKKIASILPGLLGAIVSFLFKAAGQVIGFLAEHTWLLILAVVAFLVEKYLKKRR